ncbi:MAG: hypothetical protein MjAS7_0965 [Metallosphaera javensis (ex Sakai et al. 2022)]|nr:MAG: hypothetical protein MjAS7_0965 [Metallosphaera javensis (ex Sakai et al. 2022)]
MIPHFLVKEDFNDQVNMISTSLNLTLMPWPLKSFLPG